MSETYTLFASCPKGIEDLLQDELQQLGAANASAVVAGVSFSGDLQTAYRACLWSRLASRVHDRRPIRQSVAGRYALGHDPGFVTPLLRRAGSAPRYAGAHATAANPS